MSDFSCLIGKKRFVTMGLTFCGHDSQVGRKALSVHDVNRSGSKRSGCPRPVASSSYPFGLIYLEAWFYESFNCWYVFLYLYEL